MTKEEGWGRRFVGRRVIVTGAASGIGRATVVRLVAEGGDVLALDLNAEGLAGTVNACAGRAGKVATRRANVADEGDAKAAVAAFAAGGQIDALINMAGIIRNGHTESLALDAFMECVRVNLGSTFLMCREALPHLEKARGNIVNAASTSVFHGHPYLSGYAASKGAIASFTRTLAWEYMKRGVRVNAVAPGSISTGISEETQREMVKDADWTLYDHLQAVNGFAEPDAVAGVIAMLASDDGYHLNGEIIRMDGGVHS